MKKIAISLSLALLAVQPVFAKNISLRPAACPTISAIKAVGVDHAEMSSFGWIGYHEKNAYGTPDEWTFLIFVGGEAANQADALEMANEKIGTLDYIAGPEVSDDKVTWACAYGDDKNNPQFFGVALTPPVVGNNVINMGARFKR